MATNVVDTGQHAVSLKKLQYVSWLLLLLLTEAGWLAYSAFIAQSILIGGAIANLSFLYLKKDLVKLLGGPLATAKVRFFVKYYLRLSVVVAVLFLLVKYQKVNAVGLLVGLSTVLLSIGIAVAGAGKRIYFNMKEAS